MKKFRFFQNFFKSTAVLPSFEWKNDSNVRNENESMTSHHLDKMIIMKDFSYTYIDWILLKILEKKSLIMVFSIKCWLIRRHQIHRKHPKRIKITPKLKNMDNSLLLFIINQESSLSISLTIIIIMLFFNGFDSMMITVRMWWLNFLW